MGNDAKGSGVVKTVLESSLWSIVSTLVGLASVLLIGCVSWNLGRGVIGIAIGATVASFVALYFRNVRKKPASVLASFVASAIACYIAIASAELIAPGSLQWVAEGGGFAACFGIPIAAVLGPIGLIREPSPRPSETEVG